jgi:hypothetical protein
MTMRTICFAAVAATMLAACATSATDNGNGGGAAAMRATASAKQYCLEGRLSSAGGRYSCNWSREKAVACEGDAPFTAVDAGRYTAPQASSQCSNGRRLVELAPVG